MITFKSFLEKQLFPAALLALTIAVQAQTTPESIITNLLSEQHLQERDESQADASLYPGFDGTRSVSINNGDNKSSGRGHFTWPGGNAAENTWEIYLDLAQLNGIDLVPGDEIAILDASKIVGVTTLTETPVPGMWTESITAFKVLADLSPGYTPGNPVAIKMWDSETNTEIMFCNIAFLNPYGDAWANPYFPTNNNEYSVVEINCEGCINPPVVLAGYDATISSSNYYFTNPVAENYSSLLWETSGNGEFDVPTVLNTKYNLGPEDCTNGSVELCLTAQPIYPCEVSITDCMELTILLSDPPSLQPSGSGTELDPYLIADLENLYWIAEQTNTGNNFSGKYFLQTADIDATETETWFCGLGWQPIGNNVTPFKGSYNGGCNTIESLYINRPNENYLGLFGKTDGAVIQKLRLLNVVITGNKFVGALAGSVTNSTHISYIDIENAQIYLTANYGGGLAGQAVLSTIYRCSSSGELTKGGIYDWNWIGGLIGGLNNSALVEECYSLTNVTSLLHNDYGGLVGAIWTGGIIKNSYARGSVIGTWAVAGGFVSDNSTGIIQNSYSTGLVSAPSLYVGGFVGRNQSGSYANNFWDKETSGQNTSAGATGKTTVEMKTQTTFTGAGWDFDAVWELDGETNDGYPYLRWQIVTAVFAGEDDTVCMGNSYHILNAKISGEYELLLWTTNGDGQFENPEQLQTIYTPGPADIYQGEVELILVVLPNNPCTADYFLDDLLLTIQPNPTAFAGNNAILETGSFHASEASAENYSYLFWTTSGNGNFNDETLLNPTYVPGFEDVGNSVILCLNALSISPCELYVSDSLELILPENYYTYISLSGTGYEDINVNGARDEGENGLSYWPIHIKDTQETIIATTFTDNDGNYIFENFPAWGTYKIVEEVQNNWQEITPFNAEYFFTVEAPDISFIEMDFGNRQIDPNECPPTCCAYSLVFINDSTNTNQYSKIKVSVMEDTEIIRANSDEWEQNDNSPSSVEWIFSEDNFPLPVGEAIEHQPMIWLKQAPLQSLFVQWFDANEIVVCEHIITIPCRMVAPENEDLSIYTNTTSLNDTNLFVFAVPETDEDDCGQFDNCFNYKSQLYNCTIEVSEPVCAGDPTSAKYKIEVECPTLGYTIFNWTLQGDATETKTGNPATFEVAYGIYEISLIAYSVDDNQEIKDTCDCQQKAHINIPFVFPLIKYEVEECSMNYTFSAVVLNKDFITEYKWYKDVLPPYDDLIGTGETIEYEWEKPGPKIVTLILTDKHGCVHKLSLPIIVSIELRPDFEWGPYVLCPCDPPAKVKEEGVVDVTVTFNNNSKGGAGNCHYLWNFGDGSTTTDREPSHLFEGIPCYPPGIQTNKLVTLTMWGDDENGVSTSKSKILPVIFQPPNVNFHWTQCSDGQVAFEANDPDVYGTWDFDGSPDIKDEWWRRWRRKDLRPKDGLYHARLVEWNEADTFNVTFTGTDIRTKATCDMLKPVIVQAYKCAKNDADRGDTAFPVGDQSYKFDYKLVQRQLPLRHFIKAKSKLFKKKKLKLFNWDIKYWKGQKADEITSDINGNIYFHENATGCRCADSLHVNAPLTEKDGATKAKNNYNPDEGTKFRSRKNSLESTHRVKTGSETVEKKRHLGKDDDD